MIGCHLLLDRTCDRVCPFDLHRDFARVAVVEKKIQKRGVRAVHGVRHRRLDRAEIARAKIGGDAQPVMRLKRVAHRLALCRRAVHARALQHPGGRHGHAHGDACENHKHHQQFDKRHARFRFHLHTVSKLRSSMKNTPLSSLYAFTPPVARSSGSPLADE